MKIKQLIKLGQFDAAMRLIKITNLKDIENLKILSILSGYIDNPYANQFIIDHPLKSPPINYKFKILLKNTIFKKDIKIYNYLKEYITSDMMINIICDESILITRLNEIESNNYQQLNIYSH